MPLARVNLLKMGYTVEEALKIKQGLERDNVAEIHPGGWATMLDEANIRVRDGSPVFGIDLNKRDVFGVEKVDGDEVTLRKGPFVCVVDKRWVIPSRPHKAEETHQGEDRVFKPGDVVDVRPGAVMDIEKPKVGATQQYRHDGWWTITDVRHSGAEYLVQNGDVCAWVRALYIVARPKASRPNPDEKFSEGDRVRIVSHRDPQLVGCTGIVDGYGYGEVLIQLSPVPDGCDARHYVHKETIELIPATEPLTLTMLVTDLSAEDDGGMRVNLYDGVSGASIFTKSIDHSIRLDDEYVVTITKKGC